jgi:superfamily II DNA or RNA helicase
LGEGVDVPGWNLLFLASPIAGGPRTLQAAGRIARPAPGKDRAVLVDFLDEQVPMLKGAFWSRQRLYKKGN